MMLDNQQFGQTLSGNNALIGGALSGLDAAGRGLSTGMGALGDGFTAASQMQQQQQNEIDGYVASEKERMEIESHVSHTYRFLIQIPWTSDLAHVPDIAHGHHEKLDGSGYPMGLQGDEIALQTRMMTIADIYDALTAPDRPYKKSMPAERALDILKLEANEKRLDRQLLGVFIESGVFRITEDQPWDNG